MQIDISGRHLEITPALRNHVTSKLEKISRHLEPVGAVHVVLGVEKLRQTAEATMHISGNNVFADAEAEDMYAAIDMLVDKLVRQVTKHKEKNTDYHRNNSGSKPSKRD